MSTTLPNSKSDSQDTVNGANWNTHYDENVAFFMDTDEKPTEQTGNRKENGKYEEHSLSKYLLKKDEGQNDFLDSHPNSATINGANDTFNDENVITDCANKIHFEHTSNCRRNRKKIIIIAGLTVTAVICIVYLFIRSTDNNTGQTSHFIGENITNNNTKDKTEGNNGATKPKNQTKCLYRPSTASTDDKYSPLKDKCVVDSDICKKRESTSQHSCLRCNTGQLIPNFCFCDDDIQCPGGEDAAKKQTCSKCMEKTYCPCLNNGTCSCGETGQNIKCSCMKGYTGRYCETVLVRICTLPGEKSDRLENCKGSTQRECYVYSPIEKSNLTCSVLKDETQKFPNCTTL